MPRILHIRLNAPRHQINNNNNVSNADNRYVLARNQLYRIAFLKFTLFYARIFPELLRKIFEFVVLLLALFSFFSLIYVHIVFVQSPITCLEGYLDKWEESKILRVELMDRDDNDKYSLSDSYYKEHAARLLEAGVKPCPRMQHFQNNRNDSNLNETVDNFSKDEELLDVADLLRCRLNETNEGKGILHSVAEELGAVFNLSPNEEVNIIEYSNEYGFLRLSPSMRRSLNLTVLFVVIDPGVDACVGGKFNKFIFDTFLGYDELLLSSVRYLAQKNNYNGFVRNIGKEVEYIFINDDSWLRSYFSASILMPVTTLSVSLLLRFAHQQIFVACSNIFEILRLRQHRQYNGGSLLTVVFALFGMMAIITSFFHNSTLTLNIIFMVWLADFYDSVCCRTIMAKRHWYRFFFLYHYAFYAYHYRFNGLHWQLNLLSSWLFLLHSMLFFFHHYELPYYVQSYNEFRDARLHRRDQPRIIRITSNRQRQATPSNSEEQVDQETSDTVEPLDHPFESEPFEPTDVQADIEEDHIVEQPEVEPESLSENSLSDIAQGNSSVQSSRTAVPFERPLKIKWDSEGAESSSTSCSHKCEQHAFDEIERRYLSNLPREIRDRAIQLLKMKRAKLIGAASSSSEDQSTEALTQPRLRLNAAHNQSSETNQENINSEMNTDSNCIQGRSVESPINNCEVESDNGDSVSSVNDCLD